jgi:ferric-dicitrate binding protein FerR (iron transport regulator)
MKKKPLLILSLLAAQLFAIPALGQESSFPENTDVTIEGFETDGGFVNAVIGDVSCVCEALADKTLSPKQELANGEVVRTGPDGVAEILLVPGYVMRVGSGSEIQLIDLSANNTRIRIERGAVIFEVLQNQMQGYFSDERALYNLVTVSVGEDQFAITRGGIYRINFTGTKPAELMVFKGSSIVQGVKVESGRKAAAGTAGPSIEKFDRESGDAFDNWSRDRAIALVKANKLLKNANWYKQLRKKRLSYFDIENKEEQAKEAREELLVAAKSGKINLADRGSVHRQPGADWSEMKAGEHLESGDQVKTGRDSRVDISLYAYTYLHIAEETELSFEDDADKGISVRVARGTAVINSVNTGAFQPVRVSGPQTEVTLVKPGIYRIEVGPASETSITVFEGKAKTANAEIKSGNRLTQNGQSISIDPVRKRPQDTFDLWSRERTKVFETEYHAEKRAIVSSRLNRSVYKGMWCLVPGTDYFTFVPGLWPFSSPYKGDYSVRFRG